MISKKFVEDYISCDIKIIVIFLNKII